MEPLVTSNPRMTRRIARAITYAATFSIATLGLLYSGLPFFGPVNDLSNALIGVLSGLLIGHLRGFSSVGKGVAAARLLGLVGAAAVTASSVLVALGQAHWVIGGMVTGAGYGLLGIWLGAFSRSTIKTPLMGAGLKRLGMAAGVSMSFGLIAGPNLGFQVLPAAAAWVTYALAAVGILLYFAWCWRLGGAFEVAGGR